MIVGRITSASGTGGLGNAVEATSICGACGWAGGDAGGGVEGVETGVRGPDVCSAVGVAAVGRCATDVHFCLGFT